METVEVVIRIPKRTYDRVSKRGIIAYGDDAYYIGLAIENGTVLPKGHGRLINANDLSFKLNEAQIEGTDTYKGLGEAKQIVEDAPTIIEADKEITDEANH